MKNLHFLILVFLPILSCNGQRPNNQSTENPLKEFKTKSHAPENQIFKIKETCAVLIQMSDHEADSIDKANANGSSEVADDENSASMAAYNMLKSLKIKTLNSDKRYLSYPLTNTSDTLYLDTRIKGKSLIGHYIFFKMNKQPIISSSELITEKLISDFFLK